MECAKILLEAGVNPNIANKYANTPVHVATQNGNKEIVEELIKHRADLMRENYVSISYC